MSDAFVLRQNDTASPITATLMDDTGDPVDLAGATVKFRMIPIGGGDPKVDAAAANDQNGNGSDGSKGDVSYAWSAADTDTDGLFLGSWVVTFTGGAVQTFPNGGYVLVRITPAAMVLGSNYTTVEAVKKTRQLSGTTYADNDIEIAIGAASRAIDVVTNRHFYRDDPNEAAVVRYYTPSSAGLVLIDDLIPDATNEVAVGRVSTFTELVENTQFVYGPLNADADGRPFTRLESPGGNPAYGCFPVCARSVRVTGRFGWPAIPEAIEQATGILASMLMLRHREAIYGVILAGSEIGAIARIARDDPHVSMLTAGYVRKVVG